MEVAAKSKSKKRNELLPILLIAVAAAAVYADSLPNQFVYDDQLVVKDCPFITSWSNFPALFTRDYFRRSEEMTYRPTVTLSYFLDHSLWGLRPWGYRLTNVLLHALNTVLLYFVFRILLKKPAVALAASLLFAVHPAASETVNAVSYREDLLVLIFGLLSLLAYLEFSASGRRRYGILCLLSLLPAFFAKESAVVIPLLFLLAEFCFGKGIFPSLRKKAPLYAGIVLVAGFYLLVRFVLLRNPDEIPFTSPSAAVRALTLPRVVFFYLRLCLLPWRLSIEYQFPFSHSPGEPAVLFSLAGLVLLLGAGVFALRRSPGFAFAIWWFLLGLLPVANFFPLYNPVAERYLYFLLPGFCLFLVLSGEAAFARLPAPAKRLPLILLALLFLFYALRTAARNRDWKDRITLYRQTLAFCPGSAKFHFNLGLAYGDEKQYDRAIEEYRKAIALEPDYVKAYHNLGNAYLRKDLAGEAIDAYRAAVRIQPDFTSSYRALGNLYFQKKDVPAAVKQWKKTIELDPGDAETLNNLAFVYADSGVNLEEARRLAERALAREPDNPSFLDTLGWVYFKMGKTKTALEILEKAARRADNPAVSAHRDEVSRAGREDASRTGDEPGK